MDRQQNQKFSKPSSMTETQVDVDDNEPKYEFNIGIAIIIIVFIFTIGLCFMGYFLTDANSKFIFDPLDENEAQAKKYLEAITIITWIMIGFLILSFVISCFYFAYDFKNQVAKIENFKFGTGYQYIIFGGMCLIFLIIGILSILTAVEVQNGPNSSENEYVYSVCAWIGGISIAGLGAGVIFIIIKALMDQNFRTKITEKAKNYRKDPLGLKYKNQKQF